MPRAKQMSAGRSSRKRFIRSLAAADDADRQAAAERLAVGDEVGAHAEIFLRAARREAEADEDLVEDQHDVALGADRAQPLEPVGIGRLVEMRAARAVDQRRIGRRRRVRMQRLQRIDQHAGDVAPRAQHAQRVLGHVLQRVGLVRRQRIADARLHVAPPAVIGAAEAHQMRAPGVIAREPHRLHHGLGARHVERHFVEPGNLLEALARCRRSPGDRRRAPGRARARGRRRARCVPCRSRSRSRLTP